VSSKVATFFDRPLICIYCPYKEGEDLFLQPHLCIRGMLSLLYLSGNQSLSQFGGGGKSEHRNICISGNCLVQQVPWRFLVHFTSISCLSTLKSHLIGSSCLKTPHARCFSFYSCANLSWVKFHKISFTNFEIHVTNTFLFKVNQIKIYKTKIFVSKILKCFYTIIVF